MATWNSSPHPISDLRDWDNAGRLELQPDFQRREVWSRSAQIMLIDTILQNIPMPKMLVSTVLRGDSTYRIVIDGQQRIRAILGFIRGEFPLGAPYRGSFQQRYFNDLPTDAQRSILRYTLDFNEISDADDEQLREIYSRVNKYNVSLNRQELRRADYPGDFLSLAERLAQEGYFEEQRLFTAATYRRYGDVEFVSELLAALLDGPQDKKSSLDDFYREHMAWHPDESGNVESQFRASLRDIEAIFSDEWKSLKGTRFRQRADFYSLFVAIGQLRRDGHSLEQKNLCPLREDLQMLDELIGPSSGVALLQEYGVRCSTDANSLSSRAWRVDFMKSILAGTYTGKPPSQEDRKRWFEINMDIDAFGSDMCPTASSITDCAVCQRKLGPKVTPGLAWPTDLEAFQITNAQWVNPKCVHEHASSWILMGPVAKEGQ